MWRQRESLGLVGRGWGWRHATMDAGEALAAEARVVGLAKTAAAVSALVADPRLTPWMLIASGLSIEAARDVVRLYTALRGRDTPSAEVKARADLARVRRSIEAARFAPPRDPIDPIGAVARPAPAATPGPPPPGTA